MAVVAERRLPGIHFERRAPQPSLVFPRMDVAAFVGIAASGPLHTPVAVDDPAQFDALFGVDAPLAWDEGAGHVATGQLATAVRAFFRNGGRRCWVVRIGNDDAEYDLFEVPGLAQLGPAGVEPARFRARSQGSWADGLAVGTALNASVLGLAGGDGRTFELAALRPGALAPGDVVRVTGPGAGAVFAVASVTLLDPSASPIEVGAAARIEADPARTVWFARRPAPEGTIGAALFRGSKGEQRAADVLVPAQSVGPDRIELDLFTDAAPREGGLLRADLGGDRLWVSVEQVRSAESQASPVAGALRIVGEPFWPLDGAPPGVWFGRADLAERLTFELWARHGASLSRLPGLGLVQEHPRFAAALPTDDDLYRGTEGRRFVEQPQVWAAAAEPRFPLAGPADPPPLLLPLGMPIVPSFLGPLAPAEPALVRDGLVPFDERLFIDEALADAGVDTLLTTAEYLRFQAEQPRALRGIHALVGVEEATIVAAPDAVQRAWRESAQPGVELPETSDPLLRPEWWTFLSCDRPSGGDPAAIAISEHYLCAGGRLEQTPRLTASAPAPNGSFELSWTAVATAEAYVLEEATDPEWGDAQTAYHGDALVRRLEDRRGVHYYRVRGEAGEASSDWSNPVAVDTPVRVARPVHEPERGHFLGCDVRVLDVPTLEQPASDASGSFTVTWSPVAGDALYVLEEARRPTWSDAVEVYRGREPFMQFFGRALGVYYYRVRAVVGAGSSDWSNGVAVHVAPSTRWTTDPPAAYDANALLAVQRALVRLSAARGDMLAVLALPQHYRADDARTHVRALKSGPDIPRTWSFGALYHPWLTTPEPGTPASFRLAPPDGAAAGVIAKRAAVRGAWIEPANEPLRDVVLLTPAITADQVPALLDAQINVVLQQPRGFLCLSANTLTDDPDLRPIGVRRLLSLLRRTALLNGQDWVFEPNDATLRRGIERGFEQLLARLYSAGAFTGATPDQAYRVVVGSPPNTRQTAELGQLIVELKVAPSHPLAFLTVRLVQAGQGGLTVESR